MSRVDEISAKEEGNADWRNTCSEGESLALARGSYGSALELDPTQACHGLTWTKPESESIIFPSELKSQVSLQPCKLFTANNTASATGVDQQRTFVIAVSQESVSHRDHCEHFLAGATVGAFGVSLPVARLATTATC